MTGRIAGTSRWTARAALSATAAVALFLTTCAAQPQRATAVDATPCGTIVTQRELLACWAAAATEAEATVAVRDEQAVAAVRRGGDESAALLNEAKKRWVEYRNSLCALHTKAFGGGSAESIAGSACRWRLANERAAELQTIIDAWAAER